MQAGANVNGCSSQLLPYMGESLERFMKLRIEQRGLYVSEVQGRARRACCHVKLKHLSSEQVGFAEAAGSSRILGHKSSLRSEERHEVQSIPSRGAARTKSTMPLSDQSIQSRALNTPPRL